MEFSVNLKIFPKCLDLTRECLKKIDRKNLTNLFKNKNFALNTNDLLDLFAFDDVDAVVDDD